MNSSLSGQTAIVEMVDRRTRGLGETFLAYVEQAKEWQADYMDDCRRWQADLVDAIHRDAQPTLALGNDIAERAETRVREQRLQARLLESLRFSELSDRHSRIAEAHDKTFQWIYRHPRVENNSWKSFTNWLQGDTLLYWITGKAGSGKSTLMKYIHNDVRTLEHLKTWAGGVALVTAAFFFWNSGTSMQMSQAGLLRSLLFQTLERLPTLTPYVVPGRWEAYKLFGQDQSAWGQVELRQAFRRLADFDLLETKFCFFIDGLDEFDNDHSNLIDLVKDLASASNIKVCVSSRPWVVFEDAFKCGPSLMLQDLTYPDIRAFIDSNFHENPGFLALEKREPQYAARLLEAIAQKAEGVFLWVNLVVRSLLSGVVNGDRVLDLQKRLEALPPDLEHLYEKMLSSLDPFYFEHASQFFQIIRVAKEPPSLLSLSFADEELEFVQDCKVHSLGDEERTLRADIMRRRLNSRCKGLLEVAREREAFISNLSLMAHEDQPTTSVLHPADLTVQYLHRTVKDYLESPPVSAQLLAATQSQFDPFLSLCKSCVVQLKVSSGCSLGLERIWDIVHQCIAYARSMQENTTHSQALEALTAVLDELDRAATTITNGPSSRSISSISSDSRYRFSHTLHWSLSNPANWPYRKTDFIGFSFLSLAVRYGLYSYVDAKAHKACLVQQGNGVWPLLNDCIVSYKESCGIDKTNASHAMFLLLFERGADPNWKTTTGTVWQKLVREAADGRNSQLWMNVVILFLKNGADPTLDISRLLPLFRSDIENRHKIADVEALLRTPWSIALRDVVKMKGWKLQRSSESNVDIFKGGIMYSP